MAILGDKESGWATWQRRLASARLVLVAAGAVFLTSVWLNALTILPALAGFLVIGAAALIVVSRHPVASGLLPQTSMPVSADSLVGAIVAGIPDPVIVLARDGIVLAANPPARALAGALTAGAPLSFAVRIPDVLEAIRRATQSGEAQRVEFFQRIPHDRWSEAYVVPIALPEAIAGRRELIVLTLHDLTPLRQMDQMRADFVANASHELRTPLASLSGFIDTLQGPARGDANAHERFLAIMKEQAGRMARLIDDLLSLSRIELRAHLQPEEQVEITAIVQQVADQLQTLARGRGVEVVIKPSEAMVVRGDRDELIRVVENLIENALKYGASGKRVDITFARETAPEDGAQAVVAVRDYGPGIAPEHVPRLTERFYRVDVAESRAQGGTGLGLALVKHIVNRHRGSLAIDSVQGRGATFTVRLPIAADQTRATENNA
jgi:two-component system, OmpR family, phosphate regulon sensor histidine kinase PhoR